MAAKTQPRTHGAYTGRRYGSFAVKTIFVPELVNPGQHAMFTLGKFNTQFVLPNYSASHMNLVHQNTTLTLPRD